MRKLILIINLLLTLFSCENNAQIINKAVPVIIKENYIQNVIPLKTDFIVYDTINNLKIGNQLTLKLSNKKEITFKDNIGIPYDENRVDYSYIGKIPSLNKYLLKVKLYENIEYLLVDENNGLKDTLQGIPIISPNKEIIFTSTYNPYETYEDLEAPTTDINIYIITNKNKLMQIYSQPFLWEAQNSYWINDNTILLNTTDGKITFEVLLGDI